MSKSKKTIMSKTELLLAEIAEKLSKLIDIESHISSLLEQDVALEKLNIEQQKVLPVTAVKPKPEEKK